MTLPRSRLLFAAGLALVASVALAADGPPVGKLNHRIDHLPLVTADGKPAALADHRAAKAVVVVFLSFDCPVSNSYAAPLAKLAADYERRGVAVLAVAAGDESGPALGKRAAEFGLKFPVYADPKFLVADALKAAVTPEAFVLDHNRVVRYRGRIDNGYTARLKPNSNTTSHDLADALDLVLAGKDVPVPATTAVGCPISRPRTAVATDAPVTFHRDVLPVLQAHCQGCHRPGQVGPFSLMTYKQASNWASDIKEYTASHKMPPWKPVGGPGYCNDRRMPDKDIATLAAWADSDCPEGDPKDAPPPAAFTSGWELGEPDLVLTVPEDFHVGAGGRDLFRCFVLPTGLTEDKYVIGYEVRPGNPRVVHHTLNFWDRTGRARELAKEEADRPKKPGEADRGPGYSVGMGLGFLPGAPADRPGVPPIGGLGGWAPGSRATRIPAGAGMLLPRGADLVVQTHYHRTGKPEDDRLRIGLYFSKGRVEKPWQSVLVGGLSPVNWIPAGASAHRVKGSAWLNADATIYSVMPHMHLLGRNVKVTLTPPDRPPLVLVDIRDWDYNWQETYWFKEPVKAVAGTKLEIEAVFDNSDANPNNPSHPPKAVWYGEQTTNEMLFGFLGLTPSKPGRVRATPLPPKKSEPAKPVQRPAPARPAADGPKPAAGRSLIPYRLTDSKHVLVRAKLNGKGPYNFILDTGAPTVYVPSKLAKELALTADGEGWAKFHKFELEGGLVVPGVQTRVEDLFQLEGMNGMGLAGVELHGVIGYSVLARYKITFDFTADKLAFEPLDWTPPAVRAVKGAGGQGGLEVLGPVSKLLAGLMGIGPKADPVFRGRAGLVLEDRADGVYITAVLAGSPAAAAGLRAGDRITTATGEPIKTVAALRRLAADKPAGATVEVGRVRDGTEAAVKLVLGEGL